MKKFLYALLLFITALLLRPCSVRAEEPRIYPYRTALKQDTYCYNEPDAYSKPSELLPKQEVTVLDRLEDDDNWALIGTYKGELWIQLDRPKFYMNLVFDIYDAPDGEIVSEGYWPQMTTVYDIKDGWHKIDPLNETWAKPNLLKESIVHNGKSWNQYKDDAVYSQKTKNACELYAAASALNSLKEDYVEHPLQLIDAAPKSVNPYEGFNENYGMYAEPLTVFINSEYGDDFFAYDATGIRVDDFKDILARNGRIVVWITSGASRYAQVGGVQVLLSSHTITVVGIDDKFVYITNSAAEAGVVAMNRAAFERSFNNYFPDKNQAVVITTKGNEKNMTEYLRSIGMYDQDSLIDTEDGDDIEDV